MEMRSRFTRLYRHPVSYFALLSLSYLILLAASYALGYLRGSSLGTRRLSMVRPDHVCQTILQKKTDEWGSYGKICERLIQKIHPKTIITLNGCGSATYLANFTGQIGYKAQILCYGEFNGSPGYRDLFVKNVVLENANLGILGDLVEVNVGRDLNSAWSNIERAYKLLRPGGAMFGHNNGFIQEIKLFARVNKVRVTVEGGHWIIYPA